MSFTVFQSLHPSHWDHFPEQNRLNVWLSELSSNFSIWWAVPSEVLGQYSHSLPSSAKCRAQHWASTLMKQHSFLWTLKVTQWKCEDSRSKLNKVPLCERKGDTWGSGRTGIIHHLFWAFTCHAEFGWAAGGCSVSLMHLFIHFSPACLSEVGMGLAFMAPKAAFLRVYSVKS